MMSSTVFSQNGCVGVGVVTADDNDGSDAVLPAYLYDNFKLFFLFQFGSAGTDDVEAAGVSVPVDEFIIKYDIVVIDQAAWAALETIQFVFLVGSLQGIV